MEREMSSVNNQIKFIRGTDGNKKLILSDHLKIRSQLTGMTWTCLW